MAHENYQSCIDACNQCATACEHCATACLGEEDVKMMAKCIALDRDCADICRFTATLLSRGSGEAMHISEHCAEVCRRCAEECREHDMEHCQECADACERCAEECERLAPAGMAASENTADQARSKRLQTETSRTKGDAKPKRSMRAIER